MATDTAVNSLIINKLTKAQYDAIQSKSDTELYLVPDEIDSTPTSGSENPITSGGVYSALGGKQDTIDSSHKLSADLVEDGTTNKTVTQTEKTTWNSKGTYSKPSGGIPKTDLTSAVQTSLGLADTAVQSVTLTQNSSGTTVSVDGGTAISLVSDASMEAYIPGSDNYIAPSWRALTSWTSESDFRNYLSDDFRINPDEEVALSTSIKNAINSISGKANSADLATVATSGSYNDLSNKPTIPDAQIQADWNQTTTTAKDYIKNKPTIPDAQIQSDWNQTTTTAKDYIKNKPTALTNSEIDTIWNNIMT